MRLATLIISLFLMLASGIQSCAVAVGGSLAKDLSTTAGQRDDSEKLSGAGAFGIIGALMWLVAAAFVMSKPRVSMWIFGVSSLSWLIAGTAGFSDAFIWMVASLVFATMSYFGIREKERKDAEEQTKRQAEIMVAATAMQQQQQVPQPPVPVQSPPPPPPPPAPGV